MSAWVVTLHSARSATSAGHSDTRVQDPRAGISSPVRTTTLHARRVGQARAALGPLTLRA
jgi:hypothetical protein